MFIIILIYIEYLKIYFNYFAKNLIYSKFKKTLQCKKIQIEMMKMNLFINKTAELEGELGK